MTKTLIDAKVIDVEKRRYPSKHYVYVIEVSWSEGTQTTVYRRYSAFFEFQCGLLLKFPVEAGTKNPVDRCIPFLPGKILFGRSHVRSVAEKRLGQINEYCQTLIRLPSHISDDSYVKNFFEVTPEDINPPVKKEKKNSANTANEISDPVLLEQYTAVADYKKQKNTECSLTAGQVVEVIDKNENGWWFVHLDDLNEGWVPATYLESVYGQARTPSPIILKPGEEEVYITTSNYTAKNSDEMTFERGVLIEVFQKGLDGWWKGRYQTQQGFVPACYLSRYYGSMNTAEGVQVVSTMQDAVERTNSVSVQPNKKHNPLIASKSVPPKGGGGARMFNSNSGVDPYTDEPIYAPTPRKEEVEAKKKVFPIPKILSPKRSMSSSNSYDSFESDSDNDSNYAKPDILFGKKSPTPEEEDTNHDYETLSEHYMTIADFQAQASDGLSFKEGMEVSVVTKNPSGWWFVESGNVEGWVPSSYLKKSFAPSTNATSKPSLPKRNDVTKKNSFEDIKTSKSKPPAPSRKNGIGATTSTDTVTSKPKPPPPVRRDLQTGQDSTDSGGGGKRSPPVPSGGGKRSPPVPSGGGKRSPPVPSGKPKPAVSRKPSSGEGEGGGSVAAMAAVLAQGLNKRSSSVDNSDTGDRRPTVSKKPVVPRREPVVPEISVNRASLNHSTSSNESFQEVDIPPGDKVSKTKYPGKPLSKQVSDSGVGKPIRPVVPRREPVLVEKKDSSMKRSSSSESLRDIDRPPDNRMSKTPYMNRPQHTQQQTDNSTSTFKQKKFLRKSQENLLAAQADEEKKEDTAAPVPAARKSFSTSKLGSPQSIHRSTTGDGAKPKPKPPPPTRNHIPPSTNQTLKLAGLERALKSGKSQPIIPAAKPRPPNPQPTKKKASPPARPKTSPATKKAPPPRPGNSPALTRKITYVTIADYCGYDESSISFKEGEDVKVLEQNPNGWWFVEINNQEGWVPSTFIEKSEKPERPIAPPVKRPVSMAPRPKPRPPVRKENMCRAVAEYTTPVYEDSGINLVENEEYEILEKADNGWWFIKKGDAEGWAPSSFLEAL